MTADSLERTECSLDPVTSPSPHSSSRCATLATLAMLSNSTQHLQHHPYFDTKETEPSTLFFIFINPAAAMPSSYQSQTFSSVSSSINGQTTSRTQSTYSDNSGTRVHQTSQEPGQAPREERYEIDTSGKRIAEGSTNGSNAGRITDVSDEQQKENDRLYEERMEEEYAKREGGA